MFTREIYQTNMTKSGRTVIFKDLNKFLIIYKDNTNTNRCFISTIVNHIFQWRTIVKPLSNNFPQIIRKCSTSIMILIHGQPHNARHKLLQGMNLRLVNHLHQFVRRNSTINWPCSRKWPKRRTEKFNTTINFEFKKKSIKWEVSS